MSPIERLLRIAVGISAAIVLILLGALYFWTFYLFGG